MSTWHQRQNPVQLWHETMYTVVDDKPNQPMSVSRWTTAEQANEHAKATGGYVLEPPRRPS